MKKGKENFMKEGDDYLIKYLDRRKKLFGLGYVAEDGAAKLYMKAYVEEGFPENVAKAKAWNYIAGALTQLGKGDSWKGHRVPKNMIWKIVPKERIASAYHHTGTQKGLDMYANIMEIPAKQRARWASRPNLEGKVTMFFSLVGILASLAFLSTNFTGLAVSTLNQSDTNILGAVFFVAGLIGLFFNLK